MSTLPALPAVLCALPCTMYSDTAVGALYVRIQMMNIGCSMKADFPD